MTKTTQVTVDNLAETLAVYKRELPKIREEMIAAKTVAQKAQWHKIEFEYKTRLDEIASVLKAAKGLLED